MPNMLDGLSMPGMDQDGPEKKTEKCDWSNCKGDHPAKLKYPEGGNVSRGGGLRGTLLGKKMEPWNNGGHGEPTKPIYLANGKVKLASDGSNFKEYRLQAHHLIPIKQMGNTKTLKKNVVLAGWDIDALENGMLLPADEMDIAIHKLQQHEGSHCGKYTKPVSDELREIEKAYEKACQGMSDTTLQETVKDELDALSRTAVARIIGIRKQKRGQFWELHSTSLTKYKRVLAEYERRKALNP